MKRFSVVLMEKHHSQLKSHLIRMDGQEDLCFATYLPSKGQDRFTGIVSEIILPEVSDREVHGNVGFMPAYFERVLKIAIERNEGIAFLHSHLGPGWQSMSSDDIAAENRMSPSVFAMTGQPLLGMTLGTDGAWSARYWIKHENEKRKYNRNWCESVRVQGKGLTITYNDHLLLPNFDVKRQLRTISAWGKATQEDLSRLRIGIVGLGSVGSIVAEILARTGISHFTLIDFDGVEEKNLDRLTNVYKKHVGRSKVLAIKEGILKSASSPNVIVECCEYSICEKDGFEAALDCDVLFSAVDRPWPRQILNFIAYAHLIPVIDGGILVRSNKTNTRIKGADWKAQTIGYERPCLECLGQYKTSNAGLEKEGYLDDPAYLQGLDKSQYVDAHENVYAFSSHLASMEVLQLLSLFVSPIQDVGQQMHHFVSGKTDIKYDSTCDENCYFQTIVGQGDKAGVVYGTHKVAEEARQLRATIPESTNKKGFLEGLKRKIIDSIKIFKIRGQVPLA